MPPWMVLLAALAALVAALAAAFGVSSAKSIAIWQVVGGATILLGWIISMAQPSIAPPSALTVVSSLGVAALAVISGVLLWKERDIGAKLSIVAQMLQVAWISLPLVQFGSTLGPTIGPRLTATSITFNIGFYGRGGFVFVPNGYRFPLDITVNVLALIALFALFRIERARASHAAA